MSASKDDGTPSPVDVASSVGTWLAAGVAIVALLGVIAPLLAIQSSMSDRNRALNAVQDLPQKYISQGYHIWTGYRVFRTIRVPNLSPGYITNHANTLSLLQAHIILGHCILNPCDFLPWNTGWAKLSELLQAYTISVAPGTDPIPLGAARGGTLEVVNSRTALVVNKYWILLLGLLGRYGRRKDKGVLQHNGIRRDFKGERALFRHFGTIDPRYLKGSRGPTRDAHSRPLGSQPTISSPGTTLDSSSIESSDSFCLQDTVFQHYRGFPTSSEEETESSNEEKVSLLRRSEHGEWKLEKNPPAAIHGITGTFKELGRHKGDWSYLTCVSFVPHSSEEIFTMPAIPKCERLSVEDLFWLAYGFIPRCRSLEGKLTIVSFDSPVFEERNLNPLLWDKTPRPIIVSLQKSESIPLSIGDAARSLGIPEPTVLQFLPLKKPNDDDLCHTRGLQQGVEFLVGEDGSICPVEVDEMVMPSDATAGPLMTDGDWTLYNSDSLGIHLRFRRLELERSISMLIALDWDEWGMLIWKDSFWKSILKPSVYILGLTVLSGQEDRFPALRWTISPWYRHQKVTDYLASDVLLSSSLDEPEVKSIRLALGTLFIMDKRFRGRIHRSCAQFYAGEATEKLREKAQNRLDTLQKRAQVIVSESSETTGSGDGTGSTSSSVGRRIISIVRRRLNARKISVKAMEVFGIDFEASADRPNRLMTKELVSLETKRKLIEFTKNDRKIEALKKEITGLKEAVLEYDFSSKQLKWYEDKETKSSFWLWYLNGDLVRIPSASTVIEFSEKDLIHVALWAANKAQLWLSAQDSRPLLEFVEGLDENTYVL